MFIFTVLPSFATLILIGVITSIFIKKERCERDNVGKNESDIIQEQLNKVFPNAIFNEKVGIGEKTFLSSEFVGFAEKAYSFQADLERIYKTNCLIKGEYKKVKFYCANSFYSVKKKEEKENNGCLFDGILMIFDFENEFKDKIKIFEKWDWTMSGSKLKKVETESIQMTKKFECRASNETTFFKVVTPTVIELILQIEREYPGFVSLTFKQGRCYVGLFSPGAKFRNRLNSQKNIHQIAKNIALIKEIIEGFNLSGSLYTSTESRYQSITEVVKEKNKIEKEINKKMNSWGIDNSWGNGQWD